MPTDAEVIDSGFSATVDAFRRVTDRHPGTGGQLSVRSGGQLLVSVCGGAAGGEPWRRTTAANVWSVSKAVAAIGLAASLRAHGHSLQTRLRELWPELVAADALPISAALAHRLGLVGLRRPVVHADLLDSRTIAHELAATDPWWIPGTDFGYHSWTYGVIVDELMRRMGTDLDTVLRPVLGSEPTARAAFTTAGGTVALLETVDVPQSEASKRLGARQEPETVAALRNPVFSADLGNSDWWPRLALPSAKCLANADGVSLVLAQILSRSTLSLDDIDSLLGGHGRGVDRVLGDDREFTSGLVVGHPDSACPYSTDGRLRYGHDGLGGSFVCVDPESELVLAWVTNAMGRDINTDPRKLELLEAFDDDTR